MWYEDSGWYWRIKGIILLGWMELCWWLSLICPISIVLRTIQRFFTYVLWSPVQQSYFSFSSRTPLSQFFWTSLFFLSFVRSALRSRKARLFGATTIFDCLFSVIEFVSILRRYGLLSSTSRCHCGSIPIISIQISLLSIDVIIVRDYSARWVNPPFLCL